MALIVCPQCKTPSPTRYGTCRKCGSKISDEAPPSLAQKQQQQQPDGAPIVAGFWRRLGASLLDYGALAPLFWLDRLIWNGLPLAPLLLIWTVLSLCLSIFYRYYLTNQSGQTLGKKALGIQVVSIDGEPLKPFQVLLREGIMPLITSSYMLFSQFQNIQAGDFASRGLGEFTQYWPLLLLSFVWVLAEGLLMVINPQRRSVHDLIARTRVVRSASQPKLVPVLAGLYAINMLSMTVFADKNMISGPSDELLYLSAVDKIQKQLEGPMRMGINPVQRKMLVESGNFIPYQKRGEKTLVMPMGADYPGVYMIRSVVFITDDKHDLTFPWECNLRKDGSPTPKDVMFNDQECIVYPGKLTTTDGGTPVAVSPAGLSPTQPPKGADGKPIYNLDNEQDQKACLHFGDCEYTESQGKMKVVRKSIASNYVSENAAELGIRTYNLSDPHDQDECLRKGACVYFESSTGESGVRLKSKD